MRIIYRGKIPSVNNMYSRNRQGRRFVSPSHRRFKDTIGLLSLPFRKKKIAGRVKVWVRVKFGRKGRDIANVLKPLLDALTGVLYNDDSQIDVCTVERIQSRKEEELIIEVEEIKIET